MANFDSYGDILQDIKDRTDWEQKQTQWYRMRHSGLRRRFKPYQGCADLHFPLIDSHIGRLKAFYYQQLFAAGTLASFVSLREQDAELTTDCGAWFDYRLKQRSNLSRSMLTAIDHMLLGGLCPLKLFWDNIAKQIRFVPRNPIYVIVPKYTLDFNDAPYVVDVIHLSVQDYKRNPKFNQDPDFIKKITGRNAGMSPSGGSTQLEQDKAQREGLTFGSTDNEIVLWEIQTRESSSIKVETFSPMQPGDDMAVRDPFDLPYDQGEFKSGKTYPWALLQMEIKDEGWYAPRGVAEINAAFETSLCKMWNNKHDWMDYFNRPTFSADRDIGNVSNIRMMPGQILPPGVTPNPSNDPPVSFDQEMQSTRALSEYITNIPDLSATSHFGVAPGYGGEKPTAAQIGAIVGQSGITDDLRVHVFRLGSAQIFRLAWGIYLQYDKTSLDFVVGENISQLNAKSLHDQYLITPNGSPDAWNKGLQQQKAINRMSLWRGDPYITQGELRKSVLELDDPQLVKRLYTDPEAVTQDQAFKQSVETMAMLNNFSAPVNEADDDKVHIGSILQFAQQRMKEQAPVSGLQALLFASHTEAHLQKMQSNQDPQFQQFVQQCKPLFKILDQIIKSDPPQQQAQPGNVVPMQQPPHGKAAGKPPDPQGNAAKLLNAFAAMAKAGQPVTTEQINAVLVEASVPPIVLAQPPPAA